MPRCAAIFAANIATASPSERALLAPYWVNFHAGHHMMASVPCYRLARLHLLLRAKGLDARLEIQPGYLAVLRRAAPQR